ncbi:MAG: hypothetical protein SV062_01600, partial [Thermodesulfobacteriota bacterium]|nr:hypothetical protein [Thermodesulfobacteriota bacterium]
ILAVLPAAGTTAFLSALFLDFVAIIKYFPEKATSFSPFPATTLMLLSSSSNPLKGQLSIIFGPV